MALEYSTVPGGAGTQEAADVREELLQLISRDLKRRNIDPYNPLPNAPSETVLPDVAPITGNVLIPLGRIVSRLGITLRLLKPTL